MMEGADQRRSWDEYYSDLPLVEPDESTEDFNREFVAAVSEILPEGGRVLEAGCGGAWQSLALALTGRFEVSLLDYSGKALDYASRVFQRAGQSVKLYEEDMSIPGSPEYDLVFNLGVLEHYTTEEQLSVVRGMASRSRRYVLTLVPNSKCYWYWLWRIDRAKRGEWPFGKEVPTESAAPPFEAAQLHVIGERHFGVNWAEAFISGLEGISPSMKNHILEIHRSPLVPLSQRAYLVGTLGSVDARWTSGCKSWRPLRSGESRELAELTAATADALAIRLSAESRLARVERQLRGRESDLAMANSAPAHSQKLDEIQAKSVPFSEHRRIVQEARDEATLLAHRLKKSHERVTSLEAEAEEQRISAEKAIKALEEKSRRLSSQLAELHSRMSDAEHLRQASAEAVTTFESAMSQRLEVYRSQRAWKAMVLLRRAYDLWTRGGWQGRLRLIRSPLHLPPASTSERADWEPSFVSVYDYLPDNLYAPLMESPPMTETGPGAGTVGPQLPVRKFDLIILPIFDFEFRFQRPQQIAAEFARAGHRVFWVSPSRRLHRGECRRHEVAVLRERVWEVRLAAKPINIYLDTFGSEDVEDCAASLETLWREQNIAEACVWVQFPSWRSVALRLRASYGTPVLYDCMDDWQNWPAEPHPSPFSLTEEAKLAKECDVLVVTSGALLQRHQDNIPPPLLAANGADFSLFSAPVAGQMLKDVTRPIVGYYGAIAEWFDLESMVRLAEERPRYSFVLIGQVHDRDVTRLSRLPNVRLLGEKHYRELPKFLSEFDVCLLPFVLSDLTRAVDPVKIYEYLSQGKPVVSAPLPELKRCEGLVYFASSPEEFLLQVDTAVAESDAELKARRIDFARQNTWAARRAAIEQALTPKFPLVSILVVTYNSREYLNPFFTALLRNTSYPNFEVIAVDNNSTDGSGDVVRSWAAADSRIRGIYLEDNRGFAGGNNEAARHAGGEYLVFLNPDTIVTWGWLERLLRPLRKDGSIGLTAPVTNCSGNETRIDTSYSDVTGMETFAELLAREKFGATMEIPMAPLLCAMAPRPVWDHVGELDESFGAGMFEDDDFSLRVRKAGYRIVTAEDCFIHHFGGGSFSKLSDGPREQLFNTNRKQFEEKWGQQWAPHQNRAGISASSPTSRIPVGLFLRRRSAVPIAAAGRLALHRVVPETTFVAQPVNPQPDGSSAVLVVCEGATPNTVIQFAGSFLPTTYGSPNLLTGVLPADFNHTPGKRSVRLVNEIEESNALSFQIQESAT